MDFSILDRPYDSQDESKHRQRLESSVGTSLFICKGRRQTRRSKIFLPAAAVICVVFLSIAMLLTDVDIRRTIQVEETNFDQHCVIHVHGLHHSGTGFTRQALYDSLGGDAMASMHANTSTPEDEGQFLQDVYPTNGIRRTNPELCGLSTSQDVKTVGRLYYCPELVSMIANQKNANQSLHDQWSRYWNMSKPFLIQKTPSLDILLFEKLKVYPTVHVIVMRHPFAWNSELRQHYLPFIRNPLFLPTVWLNVWTYVLELLANNNVESYVVVNYEMLVRNRGAVSTELADLIRHECNMESKPSYSVRRKLHLHSEMDSSEYLAPSPKSVNAYDKCKLDAECRELMEESASVLCKFGYSWDPQAPFQSKGKILFSTNKPPSSELVERMNALWL